jgi:hypothetical protein
MAIDKVTSAALETSTNQPNFRNIIINGDMSQAQRGTSVSSLTGTDATCDRWRFAATSAGTWTISQSTTVPTGEGFATSFKADCTTANGSLSAGSILRFSQFIEGQNLQYLKKGTSSAESLTISFHVRSAKTGTYIVNIKDRDNTRSFSQSYTISSADTWEKKTITFAGDTTGAFGNDNDWSLEVHFYLVAGTTYTSGTLATAWESSTSANLAVGQVNLADSTSNDWYVTGVQLEAGSVASDFEFLPHDVNKERCLRYCFKHGGEASTQYLNAQGGYYDANYIAFGLVSPPVPMRSAPSLTVNGTVIVHRLNTDYTGWTWGFISGVQSQSWFVSANKSSHGVTAQHSLIKCATTSDFFLYSSEFF